MQFNDEQIKKAMACKNVDELLELAKTEGIELAKEEAEKFFAQIGSQALDLKNLNDVAGGVCGADFGCIPNVCVCFYPGDGN